MISNQKAAESNSVIHYAFNWFHCTSRVWFRRNSKSFTCSLFLWRDSSVCLHVCSTYNKQAISYHIQYQIIKSTEILFPQTIVSFERISISISEELLFSLSKVLTFSVNSWFSHVLCCSNRSFSCYPTLTCGFSNQRPFYMSKIRQ